MLTEATAVAVKKFAECGPGLWWFVHHLDGYLIECGTEDKARRITRQINAGRTALASRSGAVLV